MRLDGVWLVVPWLALALVSKQVRCPSWQFSHLACQPSYPTILRQLEDWQASHGFDPSWFQGCQVIDLLDRVDHAPRFETLRWSLALVSLMVYVRWKAIRYPESDQYTSAASLAFRRQ